MYTLIILMNLIIGSRAGDALPCIDLALNATVFSLFDFFSSFRLSDPIENESIAHRYNMKMV